MTLVKELPLPSVTVEQRIKFAILCALEVCDDIKFTTWAKLWLDGIDKTYNSAINIHEILHLTAPCTVSYDSALYTLKSVIECYSFEHEFYYFSALTASAASCACSVKNIDLIKLAYEAIK